MESILPPFHVVVAPDGHHVDTPGRGWPGVAADPCFRDVVGKLFQGLGGGFKTTVRTLAGCSLREGMAAP